MLPAGSLECAAPSRKSLLLPEQGGAAAVAVKGQGCGAKGRCGVGGERAVGKQSGRPESIAGELAAEKLCRRQQSSSKKPASADVGRHGSAAPTGSQTWRKTIPRCIPDDNRAASRRCGCRNALYTACSHTWAWGDPQPVFRKNRLFWSSKTGTPPVFGVVRAANGCLLVVGGVCLG